MENAILVLTDIESRVIRLFGKINRVIPFQIAFTLPSLIAGEEVFYITGLQSANGDDVIESLSQIITDDDQPSEKLYIRSKQEGYVRISELKLVFSGPKDAKPVENYGWDLFERSPALRKLLLEDKIEILLESQAKALRKNRPDPKAKDRSLDSILLNKPVKDVIESKDMFGFGEGNGEEVSEDNGQKVETEAEMILREHKDFGKDRRNA